MNIAYSGFVYEWTNKINGKKYIGSHKGKINDGYVGSGSAFLKAYRKYGKENFVRTIIEYVEHIKDLKTREEYYLRLVDAKTNRLYYNLSNTPTGGYEHNNWESVRSGWNRWADKMLKKPVYQFELNGKFIKRFSSLTEAAHSLGIKSPSNIKYTCDGKFKNAHGYVWSYSKTIDISVLQKPENTRAKKKVFTPDGIFDSVTEVVKYYKFSSTKMVRDRCLSTNEKWKDWYYVFKD